MPAYTGVPDASATPIHKGSATKKTVTLAFKSCRKKDSNKNLWRRLIDKADIVLNNWAYKVEEFLLLTTDLFQHHMNATNTASPYSSHPTPNIKT